MSSAGASAAGNCVGKYGDTDSILGQRDDLRWSQRTEFSSVHPAQKKNCFGLLRTAFIKLILVAILGHCTSAEIQWNFRGKGTQINTTATEEPV